MGRFPSGAAFLMVLAVVIAAGCQHKAVVAPSPARTDWEHCWWTVWQTSLPLDTVAARFERGFTAVGMTDARVTRNGDTAWVHAGPSSLAEQFSGTSWQMRAVAYRHNDSTRFRTFLGIDQPARGASLVPDSDDVTRRRIGLCQVVSKATAIPSTAPREPNGEETLSVWRRIP